MIFGEDKNLERDILGFIRKPASEYIFNTLALRLFRFQYHHNSLYRRFCGLSGVPFERIRSWKQIPAMPSSAFRELVLTSFPPKEKARVFRTSGTTSDGRGAHYFRTLRVYEGSIVPPFRRNILFDKAKLSFFFLMNSPQDAPDSSLSHMMGVVNRRFAGSKGRFYIKKGGPLFDELLRDIQKERGKVCLMATAFSLKGFLDRMSALKIRLRLKEGSRLMETGGFKGKTREIAKETLYRECGERLGIPRRMCFSEYGMTELSSQYYSRALGVFRGPAWLRAVVVDPSTGKEARPGTAGVLKHVDLANVGSVMAVQTQDLGRRKGGGFELLGRVPGSGLRGCSLDYETLIKSSA